MWSDGNWVAQKAVSKVARRAAAMDKLSVGCWAAQKAVNWDGSLVVLKVVQKDDTMV